MARDGTASGGGNGVNSFTMTLTTTGTNRKLFAVIDYSNSSVTTTAITSTNTTWTQVGAKVDKGVSNGSLVVFEGYATTLLSSEVITVTLGGSAFPQCTGVVAAYPNLNSAVDTNNNSGSGGASTISAVVTTTISNDFVVAGVGLTQGAPLTPTTPADQVIAIAAAGGSFTYAAIIEQLAPTYAIGAVTMSESFGGSYPAAIIGLALKTIPTIGTHFYRKQGYQ